VPNFESKIVVGSGWHQVSLTGESSGDDYYFVSFGASEAMSQFVLISMPLN
jgi:hypothetical protein